MRDLDRVAANYSFEGATLVATSPTLDCAPSHTCDLAAYTVSRTEMSAAVADARRARLVLLDYGIGNLRSAKNAFEAVGAEVSGWSEHGDLRGIDGIVLPGVGSFGPCSSALVSTGLDRTAMEGIERGLPFFGICIGFQLLYQCSAENPGSKGLGVFEGEVTRLVTDEKLPQMQWNQLDVLSGRSGSLLVDVPDRPWVYFVHSYAPPIGRETVATCSYGGEFAAMCEMGNVFGTQFHPEKSGDVGLSILANFVAVASGERL